MKEILFIIDWIALGDLIQFSSLLIDLHNQYNVKIEITSNIGLDLYYMKNLFYQNSIINVININQVNLKKYNKVFTLNLQTQNQFFLKKLTQINETLISRHYIFFNKKYSLNLKRNCKHSALYLCDQLKKNDIFIKLRHKKICLLNVCSNSNEKFNEDARLYPLDYYQKIINQCNDSVFFILIGNTKSNTAVYDNSININNYHLNLINKTSILDTLNLIYWSDFIITHQCGIAQLAQLNDTYNKRKNILLYGNRLIFNEKQYLDYQLQNKNISNIILRSNCSKNNTCCSTCSLFQSFNIKQNDVCKSIFKLKNNIYSECMLNIDPNNIINQIKKEL